MFRDSKLYAFYWYCELKWTKKNVNTASWMVVLLYPEFPDAWAKQNVAPNNYIVHDYPKIFCLKLNA